MRIAVVAGELRLPDLDYTLEQLSQSSNNMTSAANPCLAAHVSLPHQCGHRCQVQREFGNVFRCTTSGMIHVCDQTCNQRLYNDRYSTICRISKKLHPPFEGESQMVDADAPCRQVVRAVKPLTRRW